jgi:ABC-type Zn uptake system ZnuABC Zn-binding protein ZnuA
VPVVPIYTDSLTPPGGQASSYLDLMRYDVQAIVEALQ